MTNPPHPHDDEPRSQPFQPMSYDLAPEFGTPQPAADAPPQTGGAVYGAPPRHQQGGGVYGAPQQQSAPAGYQGYQAPPPAYPPAQPVYQAAPPPPQPQVYPGPAYGALPAPPAPPKKGNGLKITLSVLGGVFLICAIAACVFLYPVFSESGATVTAPPSLPGGLQKEDSPEMQQLVDSMESDLRTDLDSVDQVAAGIYSDGDPQNLVVLVAATSMILQPETELDEAFTGFDSDGLTLRSASEYDAGKWGGTLKCAEGESEGITMTLCAWADHGSLGIGVFINKGAAESAPLFRDIRDVVQHR